jgi:DNA-binding IclR family transcriptional regulator
VTTAVEDAGENSRSSNQSIARASRLLRCFVDSPGGLTLTELSRRTGLHPSTAHRMMNALVDGGLVAKGDRDRYRPGIALLALGASASVAMGIDAALPFLETLTERTGESASLAVKDTDCAVVMLETQSSQRLIARHGAGARLSLQDSAHGQILLAYADDPAAEIRTLPRPIVRGREYTDADALLEEILGVRRRGYSLISDGDQAALSVPIPAMNDGPVVRSLGVTAPSRRLTGRSIDRAVAAATDVAGLLRGVRT